MFHFETVQKHALDRVDSDAETEYRSSESTEEDSADESPAPASQRKHLTGPLWADMTDDEDDEDASVPEPPAPEPADAAPVTAVPKTSWADMTEDDDEVMAAAPAEKPAQEDDGWTTVVAKKGKKSRR